MNLCNQPDGECNMTAQDGGPAFPVAEDHKVAADIPWTCGMSLRDYFAAAAMQGLVSTRWASSRTHDELAAEAFRQADAMLRARSGA